MKVQAKSMDLTQGNMAKQIVLFTLPILLGQIFQNLYNSVDSIVVGNFVGKTALAAVTSSSDISQLLIGFFTGLSTGASVIFARYFGAKDEKKLHDSIHTAILFAIILGVLMALVGIIFAPALLRIVDCPEDVYSEALLYLRIYLVGILFTSMYNVASGVLRAVGDSKSPFYYLLVASCTNIILDILLVYVFHMGVEGVAIATIISQLMSVTLSFRNLMVTKDIYQLALPELKIDGDILKEVLLLGLPAAVQQSLTATANLFVQRYINGFGSSAMAGIGAAKKIDKFVGMVAQSIGLAVTTFISQNVGAKKYRRTFQGLHIALLLAAGTSFVIGLPIYLNSGAAVTLFTKDAASVQYGAMMVRVMMPLYIFLILHHVYSNAVRGFRKSVVTMVTSMLGMIVFRQLFLYVSMQINYDVRNIFWAYPVGWGASAIMSMAYYLFAIRIPYGRKLAENPEFLA